MLGCELLEFGNQLIFGSFSFLELFDHGSKLIPLLFNRCYTLCFHFPDIDGITGSFHLDLILFDFLLEFHFLCSIGTNLGSHGIKFTLEFFIPIKVLLFLKVGFLL
jgi:hypothetical protein